MILLDTSALAKLLVEEIESAALEELLTTDYRPQDLAISVLTVTELRRFGIRLDLEVSQVDTLLRQFAVLRLPTRCCFSRVVFRTVIWGPSTRFTYRPRCLQGSTPS